MADSRLSGHIRLMYPGGGDFACTVGRCITTGRGMTCYAADHDGERGVLRELYPQDRPEEARFFGLTRSGDGQLGYEGFGLVAPRQAYLAARDACQSPLTGLLEIARDPGTPLHRLFGGGALLCGQRDDRPLDSLYLWSPGPADATFADLCYDLRFFPQQNALGKLRETLRMTRSLVEAMQSLHDADLLHLGIAPGHFGFGGGQLCLLDLSSLRWRDEPEPRMPGDPLFLEMEADRPRRYRPGPQTDIYAIGMTLAQAIFAPDHPNMQRLRFRSQDEPEDIRRSIARFVQDSLLLYACLPLGCAARDALTELLVRTLSPQPFRICRCSALLSALDELLSLLPQ